MKSSAILRRDASCFRWGSFLAKESFAKGDIRLFLDDFQRIATERRQRAEPERLTLIRHKC